MTSIETNNAASIERELEGDRLRCFLRAEGGPPALVEVETAARAEEIAALVQSECEGRQVAAFRPGDVQEATRLVDWVTERAHSADVLLIMLSALPNDEKLPPEFWKGANHNRERLWPGDGKTLFVLTPNQVRTLARYAVDLWDWIPLRFDLREYGRHRELDERYDVGLSPAVVSAGDAVRRLPGLRERLLEARKGDLPDMVIRHDYAWPLFHALVEADRVREAGNLLHTDLSSDFGDDLPITKKEAWFLDLGCYCLMRNDLSGAENAFGSLSDSDADDTKSHAYFGLGRVSQQRRRFEEARLLFLKALELCEQLGNEPGVASNYHQLGTIAQEESDFQAADAAFRSSLAINKRLANEQGIASTYHHLGLVSQQRGELEAAQQWYQRSLEINEQLGNEHGNAATYHQLGVLAQYRGDLESADKNYLKSLEINERLGIEHRTAGTHHHRGMIAQQSGDLAAAKVCYAKAIEISERFGNEHSAAITQCQMGRLMAEARQFECAAEWTLFGMTRFARWNDVSSAENAERQFLDFLAQCDRAAQTNLWAHLEHSGLNADVGPKSDRDIRQANDSM